MVSGVGFKTRMHEINSVNQTEAKNKCSVAR